VQVSYIRILHHQCTHNQHTPSHPANLLHNDFQNQKGMTFPLANRIVNLNHPNLLVPDEVFTEEDRVIEVSQYCKWPTLDKHHTSCSRIPFQSVVKILKEVAHGMEVLHGEGIIHHDLRDTNIFVDPKTLEAKIFDFNLSQVPYRLDEGIDSHNNPPPEYKEGKCQIDFQFDVYQFGYMCMWFTHHPVGKDWKIVPFDDIPANFVDFTKKAMHEDRSVRHKTGSEVLDEFKALEKAL